MATPAKPFPFVCPHCGARQYVDFGRGHSADATYHDLEISGNVRSDHAEYSGACIGTKASVTVCSQCFAPSIELDVVLKKKSLLASSPQGRTVKISGDVISQYYKGYVFPQSVTPAVDPAVPKPLAEDYKEAWSILDRSPKSSAVLARRCVQGAIRDFCGISKANLNLEIDELEHRYEAGTLGPLAPFVSHDLLEAIDNIRKVGNIGAHMEKDVNKVIPIEHDEAKLLLELVGTLFTEWYQAKSEREARLRKLVGVASEKAAAKAGKS